MKRTLFLSACCAAAIAATSPANAAQYRFSITGSQTIKFVLDASPTPPVVDPGNFFVLAGVSGTIDNVAATFDLGFGSPSYFFNFGLINTPTGFVSTGLSLYTGTEAAPTFKLGTFTLTPNTPGPAYSLTISAVPEPASWAMLLAGFGALGTMVRRRRDVTVRVRFGG
ncbi:PEP-CTERM sorting domain-containing protein [Sphingomonas sp. ABOLD]|uniref:PEPxxWA-CTERM sorting domain-containing protein n=1 Tax=Sphingomonas trueperi TaxID=53317 RepID=UPI000F7DC654|nr:PEPxxWA-CTERM sorting domain-containing protein [Sphingomonas trueperi]RSV42013.1 PEP-CTERM sorting domain-containing protein [Sphingomonas sp. ABOLE]RSV47789.1 PEP-CTERM sorting domain-containing protein [Sphingomonas sp. ABOLD]